MTDIEKLKAMIASHHRIVFFGGAGVSTESNIPDFRGANGLYRQKTDLPWTPEEMLSHHFYEEHPVEFFTMYKKFAEAMLQAFPNRAHVSLAKLEQEGRLSAVITQNIDGLHQRAGSRNVIEVHGTILTNTCEKCFATYDAKTFLSLASPIPRCTCGGVIKPDACSMRRRSIRMISMRRSMRYLRLICSSSAVRASSSIRRQASSTISAAMPSSSSIRTRHERTVAPTSSFMRAWGRYWKWPWREIRSFA